MAKPCTPAPMMTTSYVGFRSCVDHIRRTDIDSSACFSFQMVSKLRGDAGVGIALWPLPKPICRLMPFLGRAMGILKCLTRGAIKPYAAEAKVTVDEWQARDVQRTEPTSPRKLFEVHDLGAEPKVPEPPMHGEESIAENSDFLPGPKNGFRN